MKEYKLFARDIGQTIQLLLLLGLCLVYLYNFQVLRGITSIPAEFRLWWEALLIISNIGLGALVLTAITARFVFPSISLEGASFWILASSPLRMRTILRAKLYTWYVPTATIATVIFSAGAFAISDSFALVAASVLMGLILSYGIVGLAIALGALCVNFSWEHPSQLSASFGSFVYLIAASMLVIFSMIPGAGIIAMLSLASTQLNAGTVPFLATSGLFAILFLLHIAVVEYALVAGEHALQPRQERFFSS